MKRDTRRSFLKESLSGVIGAAVAGAGLSNIHAAIRDKRQGAPAILNKANRNDMPNLVFVFCDQLRYSALGLNGNTIVRTPHLDRLAEQGLVFDQAFSSCPICAPYRGQIVTGKYSHKNGVMCNEYQLYENQDTIFSILKRRGYHTAFIGKWHLGYGPYTEDKRYGLDYLFAHNCDHNYFSVEYYENERGPLKTNTWSPEVETTKAVEFIDEHRKRNNKQPFCLYIGYGPPHNCYGSKNKHHYDMYPEEDGIYDPAAMELRPNVPVPLAAYARKELADYYANVTGLDRMMGRLLAALDTTGIAENTIVCFTSDHGDHLRSYGYGGPWDQWVHHTKRCNKATPHEEAIHIPFILRYPDGAQGGMRTNTFFNSVDVMPTLISLCGAEIPEGVQGADLSHVVRGGEGVNPDSVYLQLLGQGWPHRGEWIGFWRGVRTSRWTYARWRQPEKYERGIWLFDRENDPYEMKNLAGNKEHKSVQAQLEERLKRWMAETDDPFEYGERDPQTGMLLLGQKFTHEKYYR